MTDQELLEEIQRAVIEPPDSGQTWPSGLWTKSELVGYANEVQDQFLKDTVLVCSWLDQPVGAGTLTVNMLDGWLATRDAYFDDGTTSSNLHRVSRLEADAEVPDWQVNAGRPIGFITEERATAQVLLVPLPSTNGVFHQIATLVGNILDASGRDLTVPDEFEPYLFYGVLAKMFGKQGRAFDPPRRDYCQARYDEGVVVAQALLRGVVLS